MCMAQSRKGSLWSFASSLVNLMLLPTELMCSVKASTSWVWILTQVSLSFLLEGGYCHNLCVLYFLIFQAFSMFWFPCWSLVLPLLFSRVSSLFHSGLLPLLVTLGFPCSLLYMSFNLSLAPSLYRCFVFSCALSDQFMLLLIPLGFSSCPLPSSVLVSVSQSVC